MATPLPTFTVEIITFFGACPTTWATLNRDQKDSCVGQIQLTRQIQGRYAWPPEGELAKQWNDTGYGEYSAVINHKRQSSLGNLGNLVKRQRGREKPVSHRLLLLSTSPSRDTATPFIVVSSKSERVIREAVTLFKSHQRLCNFGIEYMEDRGGLKLAAGEPEEQLMLTRQDTKISGRTYPYVSGLSGARIAVYRGQKKNVATLAGVFLIGERHFALTAAHVFFDNVESTGSWADSGLYVIADGSNSLSPETPPPKVSGIYEVVIENGWSQMQGVGDNRRSPMGRSIGMVAPSVPQHRNNAAIKDLPEVIWDAELDWALIELKDPTLWEPSKLHLSPEVSMSLKPPSQDQAPPSGRLLLAAGVSGTINAVGLSTVGGIELPWSQHVIKAWVLECEIAVGDCGSVAISPETGTVYGMVVAHDPNSIMTYVVPAISVFRTIIERCGQIPSSIDNIFSVSGQDFDASNLIEKVANDDAFPKIEVIKANEKGFLPRPVRSMSGGTDILKAFLSILESYTLISQDRKPYIRTEALLRWLRSDHGHNTSHIDLLLDYAYSKYRMIPVNSDQISKNEDPCLYVFSVLLELGHGDLIDRFQRLGLTDRRLPFDHPRLQHVLAGINLPDSSILAQAFFDRQWAYSPLIFALDMDRDLPLQTVIPIFRKHQINAKGGTATLWQIEVLEDFVDHSLRQVAASAQSNDSNDTFGKRYSFALKSYHSGSQDLFRNELDAFRALRRNSGMVLCLGDYSKAEVAWHHEDVDNPSESVMTRMTHNILLEYGDLDLDEFFLEFSSPVLSKEITIFWKNLSVVAHAIADIHHFEILRGGAQQAFHGWHSDIKPDNILLVGGKFKLADPGFARFEKSDISETFLLGGTTTFSAPECDRTQHGHYPVGQAIDIWSFGCVLSLAATWVILGYNGVLKFNDMRKAAIMTKDNRRGAPSASFSDGREVLKEVRSWHAYLRRVTRKTDNTSCHILDLIDSCLLLGTPTKRISARELCRRLKTILSHSEDDLDDNLPQEILSDLLRLEVDTMAKPGIEHSLDKRSTRQRQPATSALVPLLRESPYYFKNMSSAFASGKEATIVTDSQCLRDTEKQVHRNVYWLVPRTVNNLFSGRSEVLLRIQNALHDDHITPARHQKRFVITGLGGQGKSEICLQVASLMREEFWGIFWVDASFLSTAERDFLSIARILRRSVDSIDDVLQILAATKQSWLLILDNADDPSFDYSDYLPSGTHGAVLITSRLTECTRYSKDAFVKLQGLEEQDSKELLLKAAEVPQEKWFSYDKQAKEVVHILGSHTLALLQAGAYIGQGHCSLYQYPQIYQRQRKRLLKYHSGQAKSRYHDVYATFEASAEVLIQAKSETAKDALQLLQILSILNSSVLPLQIFQDAWNGCKDTLHLNYIRPKGINELARNHVSKLPSFMGAEDDEWDSYRLMEATSLLTSLSLVTRHDLDDSHGLSMHPLTHSWAKDRQNTEQQGVAWIAAGCVLGFARSNTHMWKMQEGRLLPHIQSYLDIKIDKIFTFESRAILIPILITCGWALQDMRQDSKLSRLLEDMFDELGIDTKELSEEFLLLYDLQARSLVNLGRIKEAATLLEQVVKIQESTLAEDHPDRLASQHALARAYQANGQVKEAVALLEQVVQIRGTTLAEDHPDRLSSQHALARACQADGQVKEAVELLEQVVRIRGTTLAEDHPDRLASQHALAGAYEANGQVKEAVELLEQVVRIRGTTLAEDHPDRLASQHALAGAYEANGQVKEAVELLEQVVRIRGTTLAEDHPDRLASQHALATAYQANGQVKEAVELLEQVVQIREATLAEDHPDRLSSQHALARACQADGQVKEAVELLEQVVRIQGTTLAANHPSRLASQHALAMAYEANGQVKEAVELLEQVVKIRGTTLAADHPHRLASQHALANAYEANGQVKEAVELLEQVVKIRGTTQAADHPHRLASQHALATAYQANGQVKEAVKVDVNGPLYISSDSFLHPLAPTVYS